MFIVYFLTNYSRLVMGASLCLQFRNGKVAQVGAVFLITLVNKAYMMDKGLNGGNL